MVKLCKYCNKKIPASRIYCSRECFDNDKCFIVKLNEDVGVKRVKNLTHNCLYCKKKLRKGELVLCLSQRVRFKTFEGSYEGCHNKIIPFYIHIDCIKPFCESLVKFKDDNSEHIEELTLKLIERNI